MDLAQHVRTVDQHRKTAKRIGGGIADGQYMLMLKLILSVYVPDQEDADMQIVRRSMSQ